MKRPKFRIDLVEVRFKNVFEACKAIGLPYDKRFRRDLKRRGHMIYEHNGEQHLFKVVPMKEPLVFKK